MTIRYRQPENPERFTKAIFDVLDEMHARYWSTGSTVQWNTLLNHWHITFELNRKALKYTWTLLPDTRESQKVAAAIQNDLVVAEIMHNLPLKRSAYAWPV